MISDWIHTNIYEYRKIDGIMYFVFYIIIPVIVTTLSLYFFPTLNTAAVYCYITILISALNCAYDAANRWKTGKKTVINTKLFIMLIPIIIISIYCLIEILYISITAQTDFRIDGLLCVYFLTIFVALIDIVSCFAQEMALRDCISKE